MEGMYIALLMLFLLLFLLSRRETAGEPDVSGRRLPRAFVRVAAFLGKKARLWEGASGRKRNRRIDEELQFLYPADAAAQSLRYRRERLAYALMILFAGTLLALCVCISSRQRRERALDVMERGGYGLDRTVTLTALIGNGEEQREETLSFEVGGLEYTQQEIEAYMAQVRQRLPEEILGQNKDVDHVTEPLNLIREIDDIPVIISWTSSDYGLMDGSGTIQKTEIDREGELCMLTARLSCQGVEEEELFYVRICPRDQSEEERLLEELRRAILEQESADRTAGEFTLPKEVEGNRVAWIRRENDNSVTIMLLAAALAVGTCFAGDRDLHKKAERRRRKFLLEYPEFVSRLVLLIGAGMTMRGAMYKIAEDYRNRTPGGSQICEQIVYTCNELDSGVSEAKAYYNLGRRCGEQHYIRLCMLLSQNLRKGTAELTALLKKESRDAFEERKRNARRLGEEAGTKLLLPMTVMLVIVMVMIMVPAFLSFGG